MRVSATTTRTKYQPTLVSTATSRTGNPLTRTSLLSLAIRASAPRARRRVGGVAAPAVDAVRGREVVFGERFDVDRCGPAPRGRGRRVGLERAGRRGAVGRRRRYSGRGPVRHPQRGHAPAA